MFTKRRIKSQAALEFLTTYGWAFLVIILMIGTLAYFGILNPAKILPGKCNMGAEFQCLDYQISETGASPNPQVKLRIRNNVGTPIDMTSFTLTKDDGTPLACTANSSVLGWKSGDVKDLAWINCASTGWISGDKNKVLITLRYNTVASGANYAKDVQGEVYSTVI